MQQKKYQSGILHIMPALKKGLAHNVAFLVGRRYVSFNPFLLFQGIVVFASFLIISLAVGNVLFPKPQLRDLVVGGVVVKQTSLTIAGQPTTYTILVKQSAINSYAHYVLLPHGSQKINVKTITKTEANQIANQNPALLQQTLTQGKRKELAKMAVKKQGIFAKLFSNLLASVDDTIAEALQTITDPKTEPQITQTEVASFVDVAESALPAQSEPEATAQPTATDTGVGLGVASPMPADSPTSTPSSDQTPTPSPDNQTIPSPVQNLPPNPDDVIQIDYQLPAPEISQQETVLGKQVTVSAPDQVSKNYTDVLAFTTIPEIFKVGQEKAIHINWANNDNQEVQFKAYDLDNNGKLDYVEWTVPHLSTQVFDIIFISKAFQLDQDQQITADIYDQVKTHDQVYATIEQNQYVRVTFAKVLDNQKDITMFARATDPGQVASIQVYPVYTDDNGNQTEGPLLAPVPDGINPTFDNITQDQKYRILLSNLQNPTDVFDLKVLNATTDIDYIVDPTDSLTINASATTNAGSAPNWVAGTGGGNVNITDIQTQINAGTSVSFTATGDITVSNAFSKTAGGDVTATFTADGNINVNASMTSTVGKLGMLLNADKNADSSGYIGINAALTSLGGNITMGGGSGAISAGSGYAVGNGAGVANTGITINAVTVAAGGGNIIFNGKGYNAAADINLGVYVNGNVTTTGSGTINIHGNGQGITNSGSDYGIDVEAATISAVDGTVTLNGIGGGAGTGANNHGVLTISGGVVKTTGSGAISVTGTGGNASGSGGFNFGVHILSANGIQATGTGDITVTGTGGSGSGSGSDNKGVVVNTSASITGASNHNITINGTGGNSSSDNDVGVLVSAGTISTTGTGTVNITGNGAGTGPDEEGVTLDDVASVISAVNGNLTVTGTGAASSVYGRGVLITAGTIKITGTSNTLTVNGTGNSIAVNNGAGGVIMSAANSIQATSTGNITVIGLSSTNSTSSDPIVRGVGLNSGSSITGAGGAISVTGTGGLTAGGQDYGVHIDGGTISNTLTGTISVTGTGGGAGAATDNYGVEIATPGVISTVNGNLTVTGTGGGVGSTVNNYGVHVAGASSTIKTTGSGNLIVNGIRGGGDTATNYGLVIAVASGLNTTSTGDITVNTDTINLAQANDINSTNNLTITPYTAATGVGVGAGAGTLGLTDTYLGRIAWGTAAAGKSLTIGSTTAGNIAINSASTILNKNVTFITGGNISLATTALAHAGASASTLTMDAYGNITTTSAITAATSALTVLLQSDFDANSSGYINIGAAVTSNGGNITMGGGSGAISAGSGFTVGNAGQATGVLINNVAVAAGGGNIIVNGKGFNTTTDSNFGVRVTGATGALTTTGSGTTNITGIGQGTSNSGSDYGLEVDTGGIISTATGNLTVTATGGGAGSGTNNYGVFVTGASSTIKTTGTGGNLLVTGIRGGGATATNYGLNVAVANGLQTTGTGTITAITDTILLAQANDINSIGDLTIKPNTAASTVGVGAGAGTLGLTDSFLGFITWGASSTLTIGGTAAGDIAINSASTILNKNVTFTSGGNITLATTALAHAGASAATLTMQAYGNITTTSAITAATSALTILLYSDFDVNASGAISIGAGVASNGGVITIRGGGGSINTTSTFDNLTINLDSATNTITPSVNTTYSGGLTLTAGTFNANGFTVTAASFSSSNANTRTLTMGNNTWSLTGTGTVWDTSTTTGLTVTATTSTIKVTNSSNTATTFAGGGKTFGNIWFARAASTASNTISGSNTFADFKDDGSVAHSILFTNGTTTTVTTFTVSGTAGNVISINSDNTATHALVKASGGTISRDYLNIQHSVASPASTWYAGTHSTNNQATATAGSGWIFTDAPPSNTAPSFTSGPSDNGVLASPTNVGSNVAFTGTATDAESDNYYLAICKTNSITAVNSSAPTCPGGNWCISSSTASVSQASCNYTTLAQDVVSNTWFAFVCDNNSTSLCSSSSQGGVGGNSSPFQVNHAPSLTSISASPNPATVGSPVTFSAGASDSDAGDTVTLFVCKSNDFTGTACGAGGQWCQSSAQTTNPSCNYTIQTADGNTSHSYSGYIIDSHSVASASNPIAGSFTSFVGTGGGSAAGGAAGGGGGGTGTGGSTTGGGTGGGTTGGGGTIGGDNTGGGTTVTGNEGGATGGTGNEGGGTTGGSNEGGVTTGGGTTEGTTGGTQGGGDTGGATTGGGGEVSTGGGGTGETTGGAGGGGTGIISQSITLVTDSIKTVAEKTLEVTTQVATVVGDNVTVASNELKKAVDTQAGQITTKVISTSGAVAAAATVATSVFASSVSFPELFLIPARLFSLLLFGFGIKKRNRPWGTVYDSVTKQPIDPAYVVLTNVSTHQEYSAITDLDGRYGFLVAPGMYTMSVHKTNYVFPSQKLSSKQSDQLYDNLYSGSQIEVKKEGQVITKNIPLDPVSFNWNEFAKKDKNFMKFYSKWDVIVRQISDLFFAVGFWVAVAAYVFAPYPYNTIILVLYLTLLLLRIVGVKPKFLGHVVLKATQDPLSFAIIRVMLPDTPVEVTHKVTDQYGRYYCLLAKGKYYLKIEKRNDDESYSLVYTSPVIDASKTGIIDQTFKV